MGQMKYIHITFANGETWKVPAQVIAEDRAKYYADLDAQRGNVSDRDEAYREELEFTLGDDYELMDWMSNNMDWKDIKPHAVKVREAPTPNYSREFSNTKKQVKEGES